MPAERRLLHNDKTRALKVAHNAFGSNSRHVLIGLMDALATFEPQSKGDGVGKVTGLGGLELVSGHAADDSGESRT
jgi:hypothetical protein